MNGVHHLASRSSTLAPHVWLVQETLAASVGRAKAILCADLSL
jgi:hypothetical protein